MSEDQQYDLALKIVKSKLKITPKEKDKQRILRHSSLAIENKLLTNKTAFNKSTSP
jgi:hypothetical protein